MVHFNLKMTTATFEKKKKTLEREKGATWKFSQIEYYLLDNTSGIE